MLNSSIHTNLTVVRWGEPPWCLYSIYCRSSVSGFRSLEVSAFHLVGHSALWELEVVGWYLLTHLLWVFQHNGRPTMPRHPRLSWCHHPLRCPQGWSMVLGCHRCYPTACSASHSLAMSPHLSLHHRLSRPLRSLSSRPQSLGSRLIFCWIGGTSGGGGEDVHHGWFSVEWF